MSDLNIPNSERVKVNVAPNESVDSATINRPPNRLLDNDNQLLAYVQNIEDTVISTGLTGQIRGGAVSAIGLDSDFIINLVETVSVSGSLRGLDDVTLAPANILEDGEVLAYNKATLKWVNSTTSTNPLLSGGFGGANKFAAVISHDQLAITQQPTDNPNGATQTITEYTYTIAGFNFDDTIDTDTIAGFYIEAKNWGRVDTDNTLIDGADWATQVRYPDGTSHSINQYHAINVDDDGGSSNVILVPVNPGQDDLVIKFNVYNHNSLEKDRFGDPLNFFRIIGVNFNEISTPLFPDVEAVHIKGFLPAALSTTGSINQNDINDPSKKAWTSENPDDLVDNFSSILPIIAPATAVTTELEFTGFTDGGGLASDPGAGGGDVGICSIKLTYDWLKGRIYGTVMFNNSSTSLDQACGIFRGGFGSTTTAEFDDFSDLTTLNSNTQATLRRINTLPILANASNVTVLRQIAYEIRHFNTTPNDPFCRYPVDRILQNKTITEGECGISFSSVASGPTSTQYILPPASVGLNYRFIKGIANGSVVVVPVAGDRIADTTINTGNISNTETDEDWASLELMAIDETTWVVVGAHGTWITT